MKLFGQFVVCITKEYNVEHPDPEVGNFLFEEGNLFDRVVHIGSHTRLDFFFASAHLSAPRKHGTGIPRKQGTEMEPNYAVCIEGKNEAATDYTKDVEYFSNIFRPFPSIDSIFHFHGREHASKHDHEQPDGDNPLHASCLRHKVLSDQFLCDDTMDFTMEVLDEQHRTQCQRHEHEDVALKISVSTNAGDGRALTQCRRARITLVLEREECNHKGRDGHEKDNDNGTAE